MANVAFSPNHMPAPACYPSDVNGLLDLLTTGGGLTGTIPDTAGGGVYVGSSQPSSALTNKVWYKTDAAGRPLGVFMFYNGNWRKVYTGATIGEIRMFWSYSGLIDGTGRGILGGDMDGWAQCNGQNGTPNLQAYTMICGERGENVGGTGNSWYTDAEGVGWRQIGGQKSRITVSMTYLPSLIAQLNLIQVASGGGPFCATNQATGVAWTPAVTDGGGNHGGGQPLPFQHPYIAVGFFMFVGYQ